MYEEREAFYLIQAVTAAEITQYGIIDVVVLMLANIHPKGIAHAPNGIQTRGPNSRIALISSERLANSVVLFEKVYMLISVNPLSNTRSRVSCHISLVSMSVKRRYTPTLTAAIIAAGDTQAGSARMIPQRDALNGQPG